MADMDEMAACEPQPLKLSDIRGDLIRLEETIIFALIERAQFARNKECYERGGSEVLWQRVGEKHNVAEEKARLSFMEYFLVETESLHAKLGRYNSPDENAFFTPLLPRSVVSSKPKPSTLKANRININDEVLAVYTEKILDHLCSEENDGEYGSTCAGDIAVLQALSKRIHYGKFVAEAKFQADREGFTKMIEANDADGIMAALTNLAVEDAVVERVRLKASRYGVDSDSDSNEAPPAYKVEPTVIAQMYRDYLIPLNKDVQVAYLLQRLDRPSFAFFGGPDGALALEAAKERFAGPGLECDSIEEVFLALSRNQVAYGLVPIQDSSRGFFKPTQRALLTSRLHVCASIVRDWPSEEDAESEKQWTRFFVISRVKPAISSSTSRLVAFFGVKHEPGSLVLALKALDGVNLSCLESIPHKSRGEGGARSEYAFFCEIEGRLLDDNTGDQIMRRLAEVSSFVQLVGVY